ncbi:MAG: exodeoxyribonuclease VII small subunit [Stenomitos rutilans HA7619-LM2]|nr:exodeoxyribonuclease VII small subunit [Stenomitos rutilans HA7619-LM2]
MPSPGWSYEEAVRQVEAIMARIESGELELADVFDQFTAAVSYLSECERFLSQRQQQMDLLIETLTDDPE